MKLGSWLIVIVACLATTAGLAWFKYQQIRAAIAAGAAFPENVEAVEAFTVRVGTDRPVTEVPAEVVAMRAMELRSELAGRVTMVGFVPGAAVTANQVLVQLDAREERARLAAVRADLELARLALARAEALIERGAGSIEALDQARANADAARAAADGLEVRIDKMTLRAPFDGSAGLERLEVGQYLDAGALVTRLVGGGDGIWLDFYLPQQHAGLALGTVIELRPDAGTASGTPVRATVIARDAQVSGTSRNVRFRARAEASAAMVPGMVVTASVPVGPPQDVALVPSTAVRRDLGGASVYVLVPAEEGARAPERAERRLVTLGPERDGYTVVMEGVEPGEKVATTGAFKLRDGVLVNAARQGDG